VRKKTAARISRITRSRTNTVKSSLASFVLALSVLESSFPAVPQELNSNASRPSSFPLPGCTCTCLDEEIEKAECVAS
jgi:hypothetical protein